MDNLSDSVYMELCCARTIQSDKEGFFNEFYEEVKHTCGDKWLKNYFAKLQTNESRIFSIFNDTEICSPVLGVLENVRPVFKPKDGLFASQRRKQAELALLVGDKKKSLALANLAVMRAPANDINTNSDDGQLLGMSLWTRALVLLDMNDGERALNDLKLAPINGFNIKQNVDYYLKLAKAYALMNEKSRSDISISLAEKLAYGRTLEIENAKKEIDSIKPIEKINKIMRPSLLNGINPNLKGASKSIKLMQTPDKGRFIVAADNIKTGDIVLAEDPVAACLLPKFFGSHCLHCFERLVTPVACSNCSGIAFCSIQCKDNACSSYHRFECEYMDLFIGSGMSILCFIALRILTQSKNVEDGLATANNLIYNLCAHTSSRKVDDFLQRSLMAAFLLRCLQKSGYFGYRKTEAVNPTEQELKVGSALLGLLQILQFNAHEIYETLITNEHRFDGSKVIYVGAGLYGTGSYFNHECWPSVARYFVGKTIVLASTRPLNINEIVSENYGPIFTRKNLNERQRSLRARYLFDCNCVPCKENWPLLQKLDKNVRFRCTSTSCNNLLKFPKDLGKEVRCASCRKNICLKNSVINVIKSEELYREAASAMKEQNTQLAIQLFKEGIDLFYQYAVLPHKDTIIAQTSLRTCLADTGTTFKI